MSQVAEIPFKIDIPVEADLHCHLLPAWDDGPSTLDKALQLARKAESVGVRKILVTPHVGRSFGASMERPSQGIPAAIKNLESELKDANINIELICGSEVVLSVDDLPTRTADEPWLTVGGQGRYILVESPLDSWPEKASQILFDLSLRGITAIIAHPERLTDVQADIRVAEALVQRGALLQVTARSLIGPTRKTKECARKMLEAGLVSFIASDAHSARHVFPAEVSTTLCDLIGRDMAKRILIDNAHAVLSGEAIAPPTSQLQSAANPKRKLLNWLRLDRKNSSNK